MENAVTIDSILALIHKTSQETDKWAQEFNRQTQEFYEMSRKSKEESDRQAQEFREMSRKSKEEFEEIRAILKETDMQMKEAHKETNKQMKEAHKRISELGGRLGEIIEHIVSPHLEEKFKRFGITLDTIIVEHKFEEPGKGIIAEVDVFLSNGEYAVAVEAKSKPSVRDINEHVERMRKLRGYADRHNDHRKYLGAIAGMVVPPQVKEYAFKQGFPVLIPSGDSIELECPADFKPNEW